MGNRRLGHVNLKFLRLEHPFACTRLPGFDELVDDPFGFTEDAEIRRRTSMGSRRDARAANGHRLSPRAAKVDDVKRVAPLRQHASGEDQIGPVEVVVGQFPGVAVDQPDRPGTRQQRRDGDQAQRRRRMFCADSRGGFLETPECLRLEARTDHQYVAGLGIQHALSRRRTLSRNAAQVDEPAPAEGGAQPSLVADGRG